jgi:hypothetical protein
MLWTGAPCHVSEDTASSPASAPRDEQKRQLALPRGKQASEGGASRARTGDLLIANQALSQLSYSPRHVANEGDHAREDSCTHCVQASLAVVPI